MSTGSHVTMHVTCCSAYCMATTLSLAPAALSQHEKFDRWLKVDERSDEAVLGEMCCVFFLFFYALMFTVQVEAQISAWTSNIYWHFSALKTICENNVVCYIFHHKR